MTAEPSNHGRAPARPTAGVRTAALLLPIGVGMVALCLGRWASISFDGKLLGRFHIYLTGFGSVSTDVADADIGTVDGPKAAAFVLVVIGVLLALAGLAQVLLSLDAASRSDLPVGRVRRVLSYAAVGLSLLELLVVIYAAIRVHSRSGAFFDRLDQLAKVSAGIQTTVSVGWALWVELLLGFLALAVSIGALAAIRSEPEPAPDPA